VRGVFSLDAMSDAADTDESEYTTFGTLKVAERAGPPDVPL
jgi:hypothetical protein